MRLRKLIRIKGDHALAEELSKKEKRKLGFLEKQKIVRRTAFRENNPLYSVGMALSNTLYPTEFPIQVASGLDKMATFSEKKELTKESQNAINDFYKTREKTGSGYNSKKFRLYRHNIDAESERRIAEIYRKSGIKANPMEVNIGVDKQGKHFVFFEPNKIEIEKVELFIGKMPENLLKRQAIELLKGLKKLAQGAKTAYIHS